MRRMQSMLETLTDKVEKLHLEVQRRNRSPLRGSSDYRPRQRSFTPDRERGRSHYHPAERRRYGYSSYDRYSAREDSHRATRHDRDRNSRRDTYTHPGPPERYARGYSPSPRDFTRHGRSPDHREDRPQSPHSPSLGHVRFSSPAYNRSDQVNYQ